MFRKALLTFSVLFFVLGAAKTTPRHDSLISVADSRQAVNGIFLRLHESLKDLENFGHLVYSDLYFLFFHGCMYSVISRLISTDTATFERQEQAYLASDGSYTLEIGYLKDLHSSMTLETVIAHLSIVRKHSSSYPHIQKLFTLLISEKGKSETLENYRKAVMKLISNRADSLAAILVRYSDFFKEFREENQILFVDSDPTSEFATVFTTFQIFKRDKYIFKPLRDLIKRVGSHRSQVLYLANLLRLTKKLPAISPVGGKDLLLFIPSISSLTDSPDVHVLFIRQTDPIVTITWTEWVFYLTALAKACGGTVYDTLAPTIDELERDVPTLTPAFMVIDAEICRSSSSRSSSLPVLIPIQHPLTYSSSPISHSPPQYLFSVGHESRLSTGSMTPISSSPFSLSSMQGKPRTPRATESDIAVVTGLLLRYFESPWSGETALNFYYYFNKFGYIHSYLLFSSQIIWCLKQLFQVKGSYSYDDLILRYSERRREYLGDTDKHYVLEDHLAEQASLTVTMESFLVQLTALQGPYSEFADALSAYPGPGSLATAQRRGLSIDAVQLAVERQLDSFYYLSDSLVVELGSSAVVASSFFNELNLDMEEHEESISRLLHEYRLTAMDHCFIDLFDALPVVVKHDQVDGYFDTMCDVTSKLYHDMESDATHMLRVPRVTFSVDNYDFDIDIVVASPCKTMRVKYWVEFLGLLRTTLSLVIRDMNSDGSILPDVDVIPHSDPIPISRGSSKHLVPDSGPHVLVTKGQETHTSQPETTNFFVSLYNRFFGPKSAD